MRNFRTLEDLLHENLQDPEEAGLFLQLTLEGCENGRSTATFLRALRIVGKAQGGVTHLAKGLHLDRSDFYTLLRERSDLAPEAIDEVLSEVGFRSPVKPIRKQDHQVADHRVIH